VSRRIHDARGIRTRERSIAKRLWFKSLRAHSIPRFCVGFVTCKRPAVRLWSWVPTPSCPSRRAATAITVSCGRSRAYRNVCRLGLSTRTTPLVIPGIQSRTDLLNGQTQACRKPENDDMGLQTRELLAWEMCGF
jgi:hypothetical protein